MIWTGGSGVRKAGKGFKELIQGTDKVSVQKFDYIAVEDQVVGKD